MNPQSYQDWLAEVKRVIIWAERGLSYTQRAAALIEASITPEEQFSSTHKHLLAALASIKDAR